MNPKIKKINTEYEKNAAKITELQARQEELAKQRTELENLDIIGLVRSMGLDPDQLAALIHAAQPGAPVGEGGAAAMRTSKRRILSMVLALVLCFSVLPVTAFAGGGPEDGSDKVLEYWSQDSTPPQDTPPTNQQTGQPATGQQPQQGEPLSVGSEFFTRDLLYNKDTHKQFITVEGRDGNIFYIVIDYDAPVNEDEEQYQTYFLNKVDEADLSALVEQGEPAACICTDKCHAGAVNTACPVCSVNMTECAGKEPEPEKKEDPAETDTEPDPEPEKKGGINVNGMLAVVLAVALAGGGAAYFLKFKKKKPDTKGSADLEDYDYGDEDEYEDGGAEDEEDE